MMLFRKAVAYMLLSGSVFMFLMVNLSGGPNARIINPVCGCVFWLAWMLDTRRKRKD
jgi:hypothetical protein